MKGDFIIDTVTVGLMCMAEAVIPVVTWFTYQHDRPSVMVFDKDTNDWYYIAWYVMWIGHLVAFAAPAVLWIPSYFSSKAAKAYMWTWGWAGVFGTLVTIFVWTSLVVSGIQWKDAKEIWVALVVYSVGQMVAGQTMESSIMRALKWYIWDIVEEAVDKECGDDEDCKAEAMTAAKEEITSMDDDMMWEF